MLCKKLRDRRNIKTQALWGRAAGPLWIGATCMRTAWRAGLFPTALRTPPCFTLPNLATRDRTLRPKGSGAASNGTEVGAARSALPCSARSSRRHSGLRRSLYGLPRMLKSYFARLGRGPPSPSSSLLFRSFSLAIKAIVSSREKTVGDHTGPLSAATTKMRCDLQLHGLNECIFAVTIHLCLAT